MRAVFKKLKLFKKLFLAIFLNTFLADFSHAQSIIVSPNGTNISLSGPIGPHALRKFNDALSSSPGVRSVTLSSPGGLVMPALEIASLVHNLGISTEIQMGETCASACSIIFLAGSSRTANGQLGVHQITSAGGGAVSSIQYVLSDILDAFEKFDVDRRVSRHMLTTPPERMYFFSSTELTEYNVNRLSAEPIVRKNKLQFSDFPAVAFLDRSGRVTFPIFSGRNEFARSYRTRIRNGLKAGPNFAGHYSLIEIGCGTSCRFAFVANAKTGEIISFPYGGEEQHEMQLLYNLESRLLKVTWRNEEDNCIQQDLEFNGRVFVSLSETIFPRANYCN